MSKNLKAMLGLALLACLITLGMSDAANAYPVCNYWTGICSDVYYPAPIVYYPPVYHGCNNWGCW
jgi:hypothetical protein